MSPQTSILRYFECSHLPPDLRKVSEPFCDLARHLAEKTSGPETTTGLRKLLEAKDCFVRAALHEKIDVPKMPLGIEVGF